MKEGLIVRGPEQDEEPDLLVQFALSTSREIEKAERKQLTENTSRMAEGNA